MAQDRSRSAFDVRTPKHWSGVQAQQGRLLSDDDWNEADAIAQDDARQTRAHVIGPHGSPDEGFKVANPRVTDGAIDFDILPGTIYVGGLRATLEQSEPFSLQRDWLQQPETDRPKLDGNERIDLAYLEVWQQPVTAIEDRELQEVALGGADTSIRIRTMRRVRLFPGVLKPGVDPEKRSVAWSRFLNSAGVLKPGDDLSREPALGDEPLGDATLTVDYASEVEAAPDLCSPDIKAGYLGAENQAIRIEIGPDKTFLWGFDNASPLYRVQIKADGVIEFLTPPRDEAHWPLPPQIVEVLPWSAVLPNGQKVAEVSGGVAAQVTTSYNPDTRQMAVTPAVPVDFGNAWQSRSDHEALGIPDTPDAPGTFCYLRVWNRGSDAGSLPRIPITPGSPQTLEGTGLRVTFRGTTFRPGDFWIVAVRPESPDTVVPWNLQTGRLAEGIRRFYAPLALIHWRPTGSTVFDCRATFASLTRPHGCVTVSPGSAWDHIVEDVADNPDLCLCFEPGDYTTTRTLVLRNKNVKIHGAGAASRIHGQGIETVLRFEGCSHVELCDLAVDADTTLREGKRAPKPHLSGAITTRDCDHVAISGVIARCASGPEKNASCVAIYSALPDAARVLASTARVRGCELIAGANQVGLSIINYGQTTVTDSVVRVDPAENAVLPSQWLQHGGFQSRFRRALIYRYGIVPQATSTTAIPQDAVKVTLGGAQVWIQTAPEIAPAWKDLALVRPFQKAKVNARTIGEFLYELVGDLMAGDGYIGTAHFGDVFRNYLHGMLKLVSTTTRVRTLAAQGIVVAGAAAHDVRLSGNLVRDTPQGIHVACDAGRVVISSNTVYVTLMPESAVERHGIFAGNCKSLVVEDNHLECERLGAGARLNIEGIRCYGVLGKMAYITRNDMIGFPTGIRFTPLNDLTDGPKSMWNAVDNIASGAVAALDTSLPHGGQATHLVVDPQAPLKQRLQVLENMLFLPAFDPLPGPQLEPRTAPPGTKVKLHGRNFNIGNLDGGISGVVVKIQFAPTEAWISLPVTEVTATTVTVITPPGHSAGSCAVSIKTPGGGPVTAYDLLTFADPDPQAPSITLPAGSLSGFVGQILVINGKNFDSPDLLVFFDAVKAKVPSHTATEIQVQIPELAMYASRAVALTIRTPHGAATAQFMLKEPYF